MSRCKPSSLNYQKEQLRLKSSNTKQGRDALDYLYAYRLNYVAIRNLSMDSINRQQSYPLLPLDSSKAPKEETHVVLFDPLRVIFWKKRNEKALTCMIDEIGDMPSKDIIEVVKRVKIS